jgi:hypothetical protein
MSVVYVKKRSFPLGVTGSAAPDAGAGASGSR